MLCLERRVGETITVDGPCTFLITQVRRGTVKIAFDAPRTTTILRGEVPLRPQSIAQASSHLAGEDGRGEHIPAV